MLDGHGEGKCARQEGSCPSLVLASRTVLIPGATPLPSIFDDIGMMVAVNRDAHGELRLIMMIHEVMSTDLATCQSEDTLNCAAQIMWERDCGVVPIG